MKQKIRDILNSLIENNPRLKAQEQNIIASFELLKACCGRKGLVMVCGNGGSAADSEHIVAELMKSFRIKREISGEEREKVLGSEYENAKELCSALEGAFPAVSLVSHVSLTSAFSNDISSEYCFAQQVYGYGKKGDLLIAISTSGNSANVCNAAKAAKIFGISVIGMTGEKQCDLLPLCDAAIQSPSSETFRIQEYHQPVYHALCAMVEEYFFGS